LLRLSSTITDISHWLLGQIPERICV